MKFLQVVMAAVTCGSSAISAQGSAGVNAPAHAGKPYVVLVSFDGMKPEYLNRIYLPNFERMMNRGVRSDGMIPVFPSKTFPNHYSIVTGMYAESHGLVANRYWDPHRNANYRGGGAPEVRDGSWYRGEPIWVTAEKQGMVSASYMWVANDADIGGVRPAMYRGYDVRVPDEHRVDTLLAWLALPERSRPHMLTLYFTIFDDAGHAYGPLSPMVDTAARAADAILGLLLDGIERLPIRDRVYVILVSDHGMTETSPRWYAALDTLIDMTGVYLAEGGPVANLHVNGGRERSAILRDSINRRMRFGRAYLRGDLPARFHYNRDPRIGDIVVVMNEHYQIGMAARPARDGGGHGWDPWLTSMHAVFVARGPGIPAGRIIPSFENVDIYPWIAELLGLRPASGIDGKAGRLAALIAAGQ